MVSHLERNKTLQCCKSSFIQTNQSNFHISRTAFWKKKETKHGNRHSVDCCKFLQSSRTSCDQHWLALYCLAFHISTGTSTAFLYRNPALSDSPHPSPMTRHICITYSGCQGVESHRPTNCSCSSDEDALHHMSQVQHQRREDGSYHRGRSTGKALPQS